MKMTRIVSAFLMSLALFASSAVAGDSAAIKVSGMTCGACEGKVKKALTKLDGVTVTSISSKDGMAHVSYDASKSSKDDIMKAINATGFKAVGEQVTYKVSGMTCGGCEGKVKKALAALGGVDVQSVSSADNNAVLVYDSSKVSEDKVIAAITGKGFKVEK